MFPLNQASRYDPRSRFGLKFWPLALLMLLVTAQPSAATTVAQIDLGDIPARPVPPKWPFARFFKLRPLYAIDFSPDNQRLYFLRSDGHVDNVFAIELASGKLQQITHYEEPVLSLMVGRNGRDLFIVQDEEGNEHYSIYRHDIRSGKAIRLTRPGPNDMSWLCDQSPQGDFVYYGESQGGRSSSDLWQVDVTSGKKEKVLDAAGRLLECGPVSPDGRYLVFYQYIENNERYIGLVDLKEKRHWYLFKKRNVNNFNAAFSADSLYFLNAWLTDEFYLWRYHLDTGELTTEPLPLPYPIQGFSLYDLGNIGVFYYRANLKTNTAIFTRGRQRNTRWQMPPGPLVDAIFSETDPRLALLITSDATTPERYYLATPDSVKLLYDANESGIDPKYFAEARSLLIPGLDGLPIPTHLFIPNGTSEKSPKPVLVWVHGGPEVYLDPDFNSYFQFLANQGYIVAVPNVRGSTGFGKWYASLDDGNWCGGHVDDIVAVARFLKAQPFVAAHQVAIFGESFGGYSVLCAITRYPDEFRAAVEFSGVTELASFLQHLPRYADRYLILQMGFDPRKDAFQNWLRSPYYHVERIRTPLQIHHGKNDFRVPKTQVDQLVARLRQLGREVEYYVYDDEGHGLQKFANEEKAYQRMVTFLNHHLIERNSDAQR